MATKEHTPIPWKVIRPGHGQPTEYLCVQIASCQMAHDDLIRFRLYDNPTIVELSAALDKARQLGWEAQR